MSDHRVGAAAPELRLHRATTDLRSLPQDRNREETLCLANFEPQFDALPPPPTPQKGRLPVTAEMATKAVQFIPGRVNSVLIGDDTAVYSAPCHTNRLLVTHCRRESYVLPTAETQLIVPISELDYFINPLDVWERIEASQYHDYEQRSTKLAAQAHFNTVGVNDGDYVNSAAGRIIVVATPGPTPGSVTYFLDAEGQRLALTGDLVYGEGQVTDLYSLQESVPDAKIRGYHGFMGRAPALLHSLETLLQWKPDLLLPSHGPMISDPRASIELLIERIQNLLASHFETDGAFWHFGEESFHQRSAAVNVPMKVPKLAEQEDLPADILIFGTSRMLLSSTGAGFLIDAGDTRTLPELRGLVDKRLLTRLDGIWLTHYHDDHTDFVRDVADEFACPIYFTEAMRDVMSHPAHFRLPCLPHIGIDDGVPMVSGTVLDWNEWHFEMLHFPGQTFYHGGLLATRKDGVSYFFVGDSFTPTGMDDYCMQNRNFVGPGVGFDACLNLLAAAPSDTWLINQHVPPMFRFSHDEIEHMRKQLRRRQLLLNDLSCWGEGNLITDESWVRVEPYWATIDTGSTTTVSVVVTNHSDQAIDVHVDWNPPSDLTLQARQNSLRIEGHRTGRLEGTVIGTIPGLHVITCDVSIDGIDAIASAEALLRVSL